MSAPRLVVIYRRTQLAELLAEHSTMAAVEFFLETRGQVVMPLVAADEAQQLALDAATNAPPLEWRQAAVERSQLSRFLFEPDDVVVVIGQDGLVANVAKYLQGQPVIGVTPGIPGLLCTHHIADVRRFLTGATPFEVAERQMVEVRVDDGQSLTALNEIYLGDRGHQSARYRLELSGRHEEQSSSGVIVGTGTGSTGWLASLWRQSRPCFELPAPESTDLAFFIREAWPSETTSTTLMSGRLGARSELRVRARSSLVAFGDGIERDHLRIEWGQEAVLKRATQRLRLVKVQT